MPDSVPQVLTEIIAGDALGMGAAARLLPAHRGEGTARPSTIWRWVVQGARTPDGRIVRLEASRVGGRWLTSKAALARFAAALTPATSDTTPAPVRSRAPSARHKASEAAAASLARRGA